MNFSVGFLEKPQNQNWRTHWSRFAKAVIVISFLFLLFKVPCMLTKMIRDRVSFWRNKWSVFQMVSVIVSLSQRPSRVTMIKIIWWKTPCRVTNENMPRASYLKIDRYKFVMNNVWQLGQKIAMIGRHTCRLKISSSHNDLVLVITVKLLLKSKRFCTLLSPIYWSNLLLRSVFFHGVMHMVNCFSWVEWFHFRQWHF